jgi:hypothetical protein
MPGWMWAWASSGRIIGRPSGPARRQRLRVLDAAIAEAHVFRNRRDRHPPKLRAPTSVAPIPPPRPGSGTGQRGGGRTTNAPRLRLPRQAADDRRQRHIDHSVVPRDGQRMRTTGTRRGAPRERTTIFPERRTGSPQFTRSPARRYGLEVLEDKHDHAVRPAREPGIRAHGGSVGARMSRTGATEPEPKRHVTCVNGQVRVPAGGQVKVPVPRVVTC